MALYYLVPRFPTATFDLCSRLGVITGECVVPENIHTRPTPPPSHAHTHTHGGQRKFRGAGDPKGGNFLRGGGGGGWVASRKFSPGAPSKIDELLKSNSFSVEQAISYLTVNSLTKQ